MCTIAAVTTKRLTFWATSQGLSRIFSTGTRITVTTLETGQHLMSVHRDGVTFTRFGHSYEPAAVRPEPTATAEEVGGAGLGTEYGDKVADLAFSLCQMAYPGIQSWADVEPHLVDLYTEDAEEIVRSYPHLLSGTERERLARLMPELAI